jgi:hypothetical protein
MPARCSPVSGQPSSAAGSTGHLQRISDTPAGDGGTNRLAIAQTLPANYSGPAACTTHLDDHVQPPSRYCPTLASSAHMSVTRQTRSP